MNKRIKRIIAREGLILVGVLMLVAAIQLSQDPTPRPGLIAASRIGKSYLQRHLHTFNGGVVVVYIYLLYLIGRFGVWAVKTLKEK